MATPKVAAKQPIQIDRYFYELALAKFSFSENQLPKVQEFHFKGGQGAKAGTRGHLPGNKVKGKIAELRQLWPVLAGTRT